ncbi:hypothetical protein SCANM63S_08399 [Streptomyces canarius]
MAGGGRAGGVGHGRARREEPRAGAGAGKGSVATERGGHALEVYVRPGVQTDGPVRVRGARRAGPRGHSGHGRHLRPSGSAGRVGVRLADLVVTSNVRPAPVVPGLRRCVMRERRRRVNPIDS